MRLTENLRVDRPVILTYTASLHSTVFLMILIIFCDCSLFEYRIAGYFQRRNFRTIATILNFEELNFAQRYDFENKFSFLLWTNKNFIEFIFEDNMLNEMLENKFLLKITHYTVQIQCFPVDILCYMISINSKMYSDCCFVCNKMRDLFS